MDFTGLTLISPTPEPVKVLRRPQTGTDAYGAPTYGDVETEEVSGVVVTPGATSDLDATRPEGVRVALTVHMPRGYRGALKGAQIEVHGRVYSVVGDPQPYEAGNTPGPWYLPVECEAVDG
jgi:hypothetical protein